MKMYDYLVINIFEWIDEYISCLELYSSEGNIFVVCLDGFHQLESIHATNEPTEDCVFSVQVNARPECYVTAKICLKITALKLLKKSNISASRHAHTGTVPTW